MHGLIERVIVPSLLIFLVIGGAASTLLGLALVFRPERALGFMRAMNRWVSTRRALKQAELPRTAGVESRRGKLLLGLFLLLGGAFVLYVLLFRLEIPRTAMVFGVDLRRWFIVGVVLQTMRWFLILGSVLAVAVAVLMLFFPSGLTALEARMNKWYSTRHVLPPSSDTMRFPLDMIVEGSPRVAGWIIAAASLLVAVAMAILLAARIAG